MQFMCDTCMQALSLMHKAGWLHGDLRDDNVILVEGSDQV